MFCFKFFMIFFYFIPERQQHCKGLTWILYGNVYHLKLFIQRSQILVHLPGLRKPATAFFWGGSKVFGSKQSSFEFTRARTNSTLKTIPCSFYFWPCCQQKSVAQGKILSVIKHSVFPHILQGMVFVVGCKWLPRHFHSSRIAQWYSENLGENASKWTLRLPDYCHHFIPFQSRKWTFLRKVFLCDEDLLPTRWVKI